ncbi:MAG TPA: methyltransferase domain-containing protein [Thermoanaerobaculia bacterium]|nr:methyltransferase domain-containing protein [Thermoanaerobaculia bacterium]
MPAREPSAADAGAAASRLEKAARFWDDQAASGDAESRHWLASPQVARLVNARTTGDPDRYPISAFRDQFREHLPVRRALSVGCGTGDLERAVVRAGIAAHVDGIDISAAALARAADLASRDRALAQRITYERADAASWLPAVAAGRYQLILFHGSLHHIADLETVLGSCAAILRGSGRSESGLLYVDEYVGPSRDLWCETDLAPARELFARVAPEHRRTPELLQPMAPDDPSEMIRSAEIEPVLRSQFEVLKYRPYYGNVIYPLLSAIRGDSFNHPDVEILVCDAIAREEALIEAGGLRPLFALFVARPRSIAGAASAAGAAQHAPHAALPLPSYEAELALRGLLAERGAELRDTYAEIVRLNELIREMESSRAWRVHDWLERSVRAPWRRLRRSRPRGE